MSSNLMTPLQSRLQPCSGKRAMTLAASRSVASAEGQVGWCWHIGFSGGWGNCVMVHMASDAQYQVQVTSIERVCACRVENPLNG